jgi:hypothetical protein
LLLRANRKHCISIAAGCILRCRKRICPAQQGERDMKKIILIASFVTLTFPTFYSQDKPEGMKELYSKIEFDQLLPKSKVDGLDKLTQEEKEKLKTYVLDTIVAAQAQGYSKGQEVALNLVAAKIKEFMAKQEAERVLNAPDTQYTNSQESKTKKAFKLFLTGLTAFSQSYSQQQQQSPTFPSSSINIKPATIKRSVKSNIDRGKYVLLDDNSLWEINSLDRLTSQLWMTYDEIIVVSSYLESKLINTRDNKSVTAKRLK